MPETSAFSEVLPEPYGNLNRRGALGAFGAGGLLMLVSTSPAAAFFGKSRKPSVGTAFDVSSLPRDWVVAQGRNLTDYAAYLGSLRLRRVTTQQVIGAHAKRRGSVWNTLPPRSHWRYMGNTLKVVDRVALELDSPVKEIVSAYRSPAYNARCPGAKSGSWHQANVAVDVEFAHRPSTVAAMARSLRQHGGFRGGIGRYSGFTHIDTRGQNADW